MSSSSSALTDVQIQSMALNPSLPVRPRQLSFLQGEGGARGSACFGRKPCWVAVALLNVSRVIGSSVSPAASCSLWGPSGLRGKVRIGPLERVLTSCLVVSSLSHGPGSTGSHAGRTSYLDQLKGSHEWKNKADAVEGHVRHCCEVEKVTRGHTAVGKFSQTMSPSARGFNPSLLTKLNPTVGLGT